ncbi:MAG: hypothetical protein AAGA18_07765 [Verrucomicrobiota bacterium]
MSFNSNYSVGERFFEPLKKTLLNHILLRSCPTISDWQWVACGISRVIGTYRSGRDFIQSFTALEAKAPVIGRSNFFASLSSARRLSMVKKLSEHWISNVDNELNDILRAYKQLDGFEIFAGDGHYLEHATHDKKILNTRKR